MSKSGRSMALSELPSTRGVEWFPLVGDERLVLRWSSEMGSDRPPRSEMAVDASRVRAAHAAPCRALWLGWMI